MSKTLDLAKVSEYVSPKERAKLVIQLLLKGWSEAGYDPEAEFPNANEIKRVVAGCPQHEIREYNRFIEIKDDVWSRQMPLLESLLQELRLRQANLSPVMELLVLAPMTSMGMDQVKRSPVVVTREDYEKAVKDAQEWLRSEIIFLEGDYGVIHQEAYASLVSQGKIEENGSYLDGWLNYIERFDKSEAELVKGVADSLKRNRERYLTCKRRLGDKEPDIWKDYAKYVGMSDEQLTEYVKTNRQDDLVKPAQELVDMWRQEVKKQEVKIRQAVKARELEEKHTGISQGSYLDWPKRLQKYAGEPGAEERGYHPLQEDCLEMRYYPELGICFSGDPLALECDSRDSSTVVIAPPHDEYLAKYSLKHKEGMLKFIEVFCPITIEVPEDWEDETRTITFKDKVYAQALGYFKKKAEELLQDLTNYVALAEAVEAKHFDGMEIVSRDPKHPMGTITRVLEELVEIPKEHNAKLTNIALEFNRMRDGLVEHVFPEIEPLLVKTDYVVDDDWVGEHLEDVESRVNRY